MGAKSAKKKRKKEKEEKRQFISSFETGTRIWVHAYQEKKDKRN